MEKLTLSFDLPKDVIGGLMTGDYIRTGGIIQNAHNGQIIYWLRETHNDLKPWDQLLPQYSPSMLNSLGLTPSIFSILSLGATIGFGITILNKLKKVDDRLNKLQWTIEYGFFNLQNILQQFRMENHAEIIGELKSGLSMAIHAQFEAPNSVKRDIKLGHALSQISTARCKLKEKAILNVEKAVFELSQVTSGRKRLKITSDMFISLDLVRLSIWALASEIKVSLEEGALQTAKKLCIDESKHLTELIQSIGKSFLTTEDSHFVYDDLLTLKAYEAGLTPLKISALIKIFDPRYHDYFSMIDFLLQESTKCKITQMNDPLEGYDLSQTNLFVNQLLSLKESINRLEGYALEIDHVIKNEINILDYRNLLVINEDHSNLVYFSSK